VPSCVCPVISVQPRAFVTPAARVPFSGPRLNRATECSVWMFSVVGRWFWNSLVCRICMGARNAAVNVAHPTTERSRLLDMSHSLPLNPGLPILPPSVPWPSSRNRRGRQHKRRAPRRRRLGAMFALCAPCTKYTALWWVAQRSLARHRRASRARVSFLTSQSRALSPSRKLPLRD
jgi:hypothetical protein